MPPESAYLTILDEIRKDLPWLIQVWLKLKDATDGSVHTIEVGPPKTVVRLAKKSQGSLPNPEAKA